MTEIEAADSWESPRREVGLLKQKRYVKRTGLTPTKVANLDFRGSKVGAGTSRRPREQKSGP